MIEKIEITQVSLCRTINIGNYESVKVGLTAQVTSKVGWKKTLAALEKELLVIEKKAKKSGVVS